MEKVVTYIILIYCSNFMQNKVNLKMNKLFKMIIRLSVARIINKIYQVNRIRNEYDKNKPSKSDTGK